MPDGLTELLDSLDDSETLRGRDPHDMIGLVLAFANQCRTATALGAQFGADRKPKDIRQVVLTGLGGSAIGGDFARALMDEFGSVPMVVNRDLPAKLRDDFNKRHRISASAEN